MTSFKLATLFLNVLDFRDAEFLAKSAEDEACFRCHANVLHDTALYVDSSRTCNGIPPAFEDAYAQGYSTCMKRSAR